jgi:hypothetical protein
MTGDRRDVVIDSSPRLIVYIIHIISPFYVEKTALAGTTAALGKNKEARSQSPVPQVSL